MAEQKLLTQFPPKPLLIPNTNVFTSAATVTESKLILVYCYCQEMESKFININVININGKYLNIYLSAWWPYDWEDTVHGVVCTWHFSGTKSSERWALSSPLQNGLHRLAYSCKSWTLKDSKGLHWLQGWYFLEDIPQILHNQEYVRQNTVIGCLTFTAVEWEEKKEHWCVPSWCTSAHHC